MIWILHGRARTHHTYSLAYHRTQWFLYDMIAADFTRNTSTNEYEYACSVYPCKAYRPMSVAEASVISFLIFFFQSKHFVGLLDSIVNTLFYTSPMDWITDAYEYSIQKTGVTFSHPIRLFLSLKTQSFSLVASYTFIRNYRKYYLKGNRIF